MVVLKAMRCDIEHVILNMRKEDEQEIFCTIDLTKAELVERYCLISDISLLSLAAFHNGKCCAIFSVVPQDFGRASLQLIATNDVGNIMLSLTKYIKKLLLDKRNYGVRRLECRAIASWEMNNKWLLGLGGKIECELKKFGKNGEDYLQFVWQ